MTGCVLRISGENLKCPGSIKDCNINDSGLLIDISNADRDQLNDQIQDAIEFIEKYSNDLSLITTSNGFEGAEMDFGVWNKAPEFYAQSHLFPNTLVKLAGDNKIGLMLSIYLTSDS